MGRASKRRIGAECGRRVEGAGAGRRIARLAAGAVLAALLSALLGASAALASGQEVASWGGNKYGQLGDGTTTSRSHPVFVCAPGSCSGGHLKEVTAISAGGSHSLALLASEEVVAWGNGREGALGNAETAKQTTPVYVCEPEYASSGPCPASERLKGVVAISAGDGASNVALLKNGMVVTWGSNQDGQMGDGIATLAPSGYSDVPEYVCEPQMPYTAECRNIGANNTGYRGAFLTGVSAVAAAPDHDAAIIEAGGELVTWGVDNRGQLGQGDWNLFNDVPRHVCEVEYTYNVTVSPDNVEPRCPSGHYLVGAELMAFGDRHNVVQFSGPYCVRVPIKEGGHSGEGEACRRRDQEAAQEKGEEGKKKKEKGKEGGGRTWEEEGWEWVEEHAHHAVVSFGNNEEGQLGDGLSVKPSWPAGQGGPAYCESHTPCSEVPIHVCKASWGPLGSAPCEYPEYLEPVTGVAAGGDHSLALSEFGEVLSWGENNQGEEGDATHTGPDECSFIATPVDYCAAVPEPVLTGITSLSGGVLHELALQASGEVLAWGAGVTGQLGNGAVAEQDSPVHVCAVGGCGGGVLKGASAVSAGVNHSLALGTFPGWVPWSQKGTELPKGGPHVPVKTSGALTLQTESGPITCKVKDIEEIWNPITGNGEDLITSFVLKCSSKLCPAKQKTEVIALGLPWPTHLTSGSPTRDEIEDVDLEIRCSTSGKLDEYKGTLAPEVGNSVLVFGPGSGELEDSSHHKMSVSGTDKLAQKTTA